MDACYWSSTAEATGTDPSFRGRARGRGRSLADGRRPLRPEWSIGWLASFFQGCRIVCNKADLGIWSRGVPCRGPPCEWNTRPSVGHRASAASCLLTEPFTPSCLSAQIDALRVSPSSRKCSKDIRTSYTISSASVLGAPQVAEYSGDRVGARQSIGVCDNLISNCSQVVDFKVERCPSG